MTFLKATCCHQELIIEETLLKESVQAGTLSPSEAALAMDDIHERMLGLQQISIDDCPTNEATPLPPTLFKLF